MQKNDYRRALIMLRPLDVNWSGHIRLERRTLMGSMEVTVSGPAGEERLLAVLLGDRGGRMQAYPLGEMKNGGRGQAGLHCEFDPRNMDGLTLEQYPLAAVARWDKEGWKLAMTGFPNGSREVDWSAVRRAVWSLSERDKRENPGDQAGIRAGKAAESRSKSGDNQAHTEEIRGETGGLSADSQSEEALNRQEKALLAHPTDPEWSDPDGTDAPAGQPSETENAFGPPDEMPSVQAENSRPAGREDRPAKNVHWPDEIDVPGDGEPSNAATDEREFHNGRDSKISFADMDIQAGMSDLYEDMDTPAGAGDSYEDMDIPAGAGDSYEDMDIPAGAGDSYEDMDIPAGASDSYANMDAPAAGYGEADAGEPREGSLKYEGTEMSAGQVAACAWGLDMECANMDLPSPAYPGERKAEGDWAPNDRPNSADEGGAGENGGEDLPKTALEALGLSEETEWPEGIDALRGLFMANPPFSPGPEPGFIYVRADMPEGSGYKYTLTGLKAEGGKIVEAIYAVPSPFAAEPPPGMEDYAWSEGYWILRVPQIV